MDVSVVVPTYQRRESLRRLLEALRDQTLPSSRFEVVVSIDGSDDGTREMLTASEESYRLCALWHPNRGRAAACNAGIRAAKGEVVVILDDDMRPSPRCLEAHLEAHRPGERRCVIGAAPIQVPAGSTPLVAYMAQKFNTHLTRLAEPGHRFATRDFYSGNASVRRHDLVAVGLFDESFREYGNEDLELAVRLRAAGVDMVFAPEALAEQLYEKSFSELARDTMAKGRTSLEFARKHPEVRADLQLAQFDLGSWQWRLVRNALLDVTAWVSATSTGLVRLTVGVERLGLRRLDPWYALLLDYFYWLGVRQSGDGLVAHRHHTAPVVDPQNEQLRRVDWRFFLGKADVDRVVYEADPGLESALRASFAEVTAIGSASASCQHDLAVLSDPSPGALRRANACLAPGGACYVEYRRPGLAGPARLRRQLQRAGFDAPECYWVWPPSHRAPAQFWLPLEAPGAIAHFLRTRPQPPGAGRRFMANVRAVVWRTAWRLGALVPICAIASKPDGDAVSTSLSREIVRRWSVWKLPSQPSSVSCIMLTGGQSRLNKVIVLAFADNASTPVLAIKLARVPESVAGLDREVAALTAASRESFAAQAEVPRIVFREQLCGTPAVGETPVEGEPLSTIMTEERYDEIARWVTDALCALATGREAVEVAAWWDRLVAPVVSGFEARFGAHADASQLELVHGALRALPPLPLVPEHRDCSPWNVLRTRQGRLALLDWESAEPDGLPALDVVYFLVNAAFFAEKTLGTGREVVTYGRLLQPESPTGRAFAEALVRYGTATGLDTTVLTSLRTLAWMLHAVVEYDRITTTRPELPTDDAVGASVYFALWQRDADRLSVTG